MADFAETSLGKWLQPQHLRNSATEEIADRFARSPERYVVIDDFLLPHRVAKIRQLLLSDGRMEPIYKIYGKSGEVSAAEFYAVPDKERFIFEEKYRAPLPGKEMAESVLADFQFRRELDTDEFRGWLAAATGRTINRTGKVVLKRLDRSHFLRWHDDCVDNRMVCMVLYVHEGWRPEFAGRFQIRRISGGIDSVEPIGNRVILFDPQIKTEHAVEDISDAAGNWLRLNYSAWFYV